MGIEWDEILEEEAHINRMRRAYEEAYAKEAGRIQAALDGKVAEYLVGQELLERKIRTTREYRGLIEEGRSRISRMDDEE
jgi:hypothetical protein